MRRDFRLDDWADGLGPLDAIVKMQAAHELRHKTRLPMLLQRINEAIESGGPLLFCDHYFEVGNARNSGLYPTYREQSILLGNAGFQDIALLLDEGGMALYRCFKD